MLFRNIFSNHSIAILTKSIKTKVFMKTRTNLIKPGVIAESYDYRIVRLQNHAFPCELNNYVLYLLVISLEKTLKIHKRSTALERSVKYFTGGLKTV